MSEEQKAYDLKLLAEKIKSDVLLDVAEEGAGKLFIVILDWVVEEAAKSKTPMDDVLIAIAPILKKEGLKFIDKIHVPKEEA